MSIIVPVMKMPGNNLEALGKNISNFRENAGFLTQTAFAEAVGATQATVSAWEAGKIDIPYSTICRIAEILKVSPAALSDSSVPITESPEKLRLLCITAILNANPSQLDIIFTQIKSTYPDLIESTANKPKRRASR